ncbi:probable Xaa-Pro aminopeptidase P isoform X1 [Nilaparvata lugens]|uniref:probable Xaa-Pro aminopeptidase P isoform X1 n=2 Tax=Nilaparvata lugens TaxID=108931 RepID=UPI00193D94AE|nr:probable Xaa-Pro aminopeptidase P isoform X1 [Nilaparvata lugens]
MITRKFAVVMILYALGGMCKGQETPSTVGERRLCPPSADLPQPADRFDSRSRLDSLRNEMKKQNVIQGPIIDAYLVATGDEHQSEYVADRDKRLQFISGFSGSAGIAVITATKAALWTDGRYHSQADNQLSCDWMLMGRGDKPKNLTDWLREEVRIGARVGADPALMANSQWEVLNKKLSEYSIFLLQIKNNLIDQIWTEDRPAYSQHQAYPWPQLYAGKGHMAKILAVRNEMREQECDALIITALDEIAWLLNIRGRDIPYNPVLRSYVIITRDQVKLYVNPAKLNDAVKRQLSTESCFSPLCVRIQNYENIWEDLRTFSQLWKRVLLPTASEFSPGVSRAVFMSIPVDKRKLAPSPIVAMKAEKNLVEREGMRNAHIRDAAAICEFMSMFEEQMDNNEGEWTEMKVAETLDEIRMQQNMSRGISFPTIVGFGSHGALPHYEPTNLTNVAIDKSSTLVIDSGGHYLDGSTDVTRTYHFGNPSEEEKDSYTRVLMGHIDMASFVFPKNFPMNGADVLARGPLWQDSKDYAHGTGHGIGVFLNIHEAPILLSWSKISNGKMFKEGYFFTDEPGYYKTGSFGIRLENVLEVVKKDEKSDSSDEFLAFRAVTLVPFEMKLVNMDLLSPMQRHWLNEYNARIRSEVGAELKRQKRMRAYNWMMKKTKDIPEVCCRASSARSGECVSCVPATVLAIVLLAFSI